MLTWFFQPPYSFSAQTARAWIAIVLSFTLMLLGMFGPTFAILHGYLEPLCAQHAATYGFAAGRYDIPSRYEEHACTFGSFVEADFVPQTTVPLLEIGGTLAWLMLVIQDLSPPLGMVGGLLIGFLLWQRIDRLGKRILGPRLHQRGRRVGW